MFPIESHIIVHHKGVLLFDEHRADDERYRNEELQAEQHRAQAAAFGGISERTLDGKGWRH